MSETSAIVTPLLAQLQRAGIWAMRVQSGRAKGGKIRLAPAGTPDVIGYLPSGRMLAIECKRPGEERTEVQMVWGNRACANGVAYLVATSAAEAMRWVGLLIEQRGGGRAAS